MSCVSVRNASPTSSAGRLTPRFGTFDPRDDGLETVMRPAEICRGDNRPRRARSIGTLEHVADGGDVIAVARWRSQCSGQTRQFDGVAFHFGQAECLFFLAEMEEQLTMVYPSSAKVRSKLPM